MVAGPWYVQKRGCHHSTLTPALPPTLWPGWLNANEGRIAIYAVDSRRYQALARDPKLTQTRAMWSKRG